MQHEKCSLSETVTNASPGWLAALAALETPPPDLAATKLHQASALASPALHLKCVAHHKQRERADSGGHMPPYETRGINY